MSGTVYSGMFTSKILYPGVSFTYSIHVPEHCEGQTENALLVTCDGLNETEAWAMEQLFHSGEAPACISIGLTAGILKSTLSRGSNRPQRMLNYDFFGPVYPNFIVDEFLPAILKEYSLSISDSPDLHMASGGSSGGICAWNMAWYRTDFFHRVYMSSPSFLSMGNGREIPARIRKVETKPIRVFTDFSENEPDDYFGSSYCAADDVERALRFAGYDMKAEFHAGEGHCSQRGNPESALERMRFLWKNWEEPIRVQKLSPRMEQLISLDFPWEVTSEPFPEKVRATLTEASGPTGTYTAQGGEIFFTTPDGFSRKVADSYSNISSLAVSCDQWRLYIGDRNRGCVYVSNILPDGSLSGSFTHASLHLETDFRIPGALDLCTDSVDRLCVATELGIQSVRSFGLIDAIIPLPGGAIPEAIEFVTNVKSSYKKETYLYALANGVVYRRRWFAGYRRGERYSLPSFTSYYDSPPLLQALRK